MLLVVSSCHLLFLPLLSILPKKLFLGPVLGVIDCYCWWDVEQYSFVPNLIRQEKIYLYISRILHTKRYRFDLQESEKKFSIYWTLFYVISSYPALAIPLSFVKVLRPGKFMTPTLIGCLLAEFIKTFSKVISMDILVALLSSILFDIDGLT